MRNSSLALLLGTLVFTAGLLILVNNPKSYLHAAVHDALEQGQALMDDYHDRMEERMQAAMAKLFDELDVDKDGAIQRGEFKGGAVSVAAAMRAVDLKPPQVPDVRLPTTTNDALWWIFAIGTLQVMFLSMLFIMVHVHALVFRSKPSVDLAVDYIRAEPKHASIQEALHYDTPLNKAGIYERLKMAFFICSGLIFMRVAVLLIFFVLGVFAIQMAVLGGRNRHTHPRWFRFWTSIMTFAGSMMLIAVGFSRIASHGALADSSHCKLYVGNHVCIVEVVYLFIHGMMPSFVSRAENLSVPLFPAIVKGSDAILVNRDAAESRATTLRTILARARDTDSTPLMLFPEGTCDAGTALFSFRRGAFEAGEPIQMVCFKFPGKHFRPTWNGRATGGNDIGDLVLRLLCQFVNHMEVVFLPVYHPTEEERQNPKLYAAHAQKMMAAVLREPVSGASYADYVAAAKLYSSNKRGHSKAQ